MFYSPTFLARKGPLGTVWIAAHLQHRLKKSHYASIRIPETVQEIMFPAVPIALRMSGHLLLGVVRIYSKKVDDLFKDCNSALTALTKAFASVNVNLPEDAGHAPVHSITLPETFDLDALQLEDGTYNDRSPDNHLRSLEEITLPDQMPFGREQYVVVTFDEDISADASHQEQVPDLGARPMEQDVVPQNSSGHNQTEVINAPSHPVEVLAAEEESNLGLRSSGLTNQTEVPIEGINDNVSPQNIPEIEVMRHTVGDLSSEKLPSVLPDHGDDMAGEQNRCLDQNTNERASLSPIMEDALASGGQSLPFQLHPDPPASVASQEAPETATHLSFGHKSPDLAIRSTPPVPQQNQIKRKRKKQFYDESTVLTNKFMKAAINDCQNLLRKRRNVPCSALGVWKLQKRLRKEQVFEDPLITGLSEDLSNAFSEDLIATRPHLAKEISAEPSVPTSIPVTETFQDPGPGSLPSFASEPPPEPGIRDTHSPENPTIAEGSFALPSDPATGIVSETFVAQSPRPATEISTEPQATDFPAYTPEPDMEIESLRHYQGPSASNIFSETMDLTSRGDESMPLSARNLWSGSELQEGNTGTSVLPSPDLAGSSGTYASAQDTPVTYLGEQSSAGTFRLPDIPELHSVDDGDLNFLEADSSLHSGSQASRETDMLSVRSRATAQFLIRNSPTTSSEESSGNLSLNKILEGRPRKLCARMFYETLVLKSHGLVDVQQEEPYGDITLKLTPKISKLEL